MKKNILLMGIAALCLNSCCPTKNTTTTTTENKLIANGKLWSSYYQQNAAEYEALCLQAFNIAQLRLDEALAKKGTQPLAIVTDIDETFLDNSPFEAYSVTPDAIADDGRLAFWVDVAMHHNRAVTGGQSGSDKS